MNAALPPSAKFLSLARLNAYARIFLVVELFFAGFLTLGTYGLITPLSHPLSTDYVSFYAAGYLANHGPAIDVYNQTIHHRAENFVKNTNGLEYNYFFYPPIFIILCSILSRLPYLVSFFFFEGVTFLAYAFSIRKIIGSTRYLLPFIAFPAVLWSIGVGQNSLLSAALLAGGTLLIDDSPWFAGMFFGCLIYKPHFGLLIPVALIAGRHWRAFFSASVTVTILISFTTLLYGVEIWRAYLDAAISAQYVFEQGHVPFSGLVSPFGAVRLLGWPPSVAYGIQIGVTLALILFVSIIWSAKLSLPIRAAALTASIIPSVPVVLFYDLTIAGVAIAWLTHLGRRAGFSSWEKMIYCCVGLTTVYSRSFAMRYGAPIGPLAAAALLAIVTVRARQEIILRNMNPLNAS